MTGQCQLSSNLSLQSAYFLGKETVGKLGLMSGISEQYPIVSLRLGELVSTALQKFRCNNVDAQCDQGVERWIDQVGRIGMTHPSSLHGRTVPARPFGL